MKYGHVSTNPAEEVIPPVLPDNLPRPISEDDLERALMEAPDEIAAMMQLAARSGLRCKEIAGVHSRDIQLNRNPQVLVVAEPKGHRQRAVPLHPVVVASLSTFGIPDDGYVFPGYPGLDRRGGADPTTHTKPKTVSRKIAKYLRSCGIDATAHQLRHRAGTILYRTSKDLRMVQEFLGHRSVVTTQGYTRIDLDDAAQWVDRI